jgi:hypothetical protein
VDTSEHACCLLPFAQARDEFYQCVKECGVLYSGKGPVPSKCKQLRGRFESACLGSWVSGGWCVCVWYPCGGAAQQQAAVPDSLPLCTALFKQVKHFDELQEAKARAVKNLHNAINTKAATSAGNLAGTSQQQQ